MSIVNNWRQEQSVEFVVPGSNDLEQVANDVCEKALNEAKFQLHPLLRDVELNHLDQRAEFVRAFKLALERSIARKLAAWQPGIQAVFKFDEGRGANGESWDGSIHLLVKVPRLSNALKILGRRLDRKLVMHLKQLGWTRARKRQSILDIQQVTPSELRHGVSYGAMFYAVYNVPVKIWPQDVLHERRHHRR